MKPYSRTTCHLMPTLLLAGACLLLVPPTMNTRAFADDAPSLVAQLLLQYRQIESVSCEVRRDILTPEGTIRWLSRVYYQTPDRLHAANASPLPRLILSDGETMYQHNAGQPRGFRRALEDLDETMRINLHRIPGTLMDHLLRIEHAPEIPLEPTADAPIRRAYETTSTYVVLEADEHNRLLRVNFFNTQDRNNPIGTIMCDAFEEVIPGVWIAMSHQISFRSGKNDIQERIRFSQYKANEQLPADIFNPDAFFPPAVEWVDSFDQLAK